MGRPSLCCGMRSEEEIRARLAALRRMKPPEDLFRPDPEGEGERGQNAVNFYLWVIVREAAIRTLEWVLEEDQEDLGRGRR